MRAFSRGVDGWQVGKDWKLREHAIGPCILSLKANDSSLQFPNSVNENAR